MNNTKGYKQEMALRANNTEPIGNESLDKWQLVGSGGFGRVYKARHKSWGFDVAIKIHHDGVCSFTPAERALYEEISYMEKASCEFVLRVYGIYLGCPPVGGTYMQQGIVMELMRRGSLQSLLNGLGCSPPWALAFRLAHQVALGMNFLHSRNLLHHDLQPNNVLLNDELNGKLADFGLSRVSISALSSSRGALKESGGSYKYMPPEAFEASYEPVRAFDKYSYGILLWSILTGKEPYPAADYNLVALRIPMGDRPPCWELDRMKAAGLKELIDLMKRCWDKSPSNRPTLTECLEVTERVFSMHDREIHDVVHQVLKILDSATDQTFGITEPSLPNSTTDCVSFTKLERSSMQDSANVSNEEMSETDKAKFIDDNRPELIQVVSEVMAIAEEMGNMVHGEAYSVIEAKETSQEKMRALYQRALRPGGLTVKAAFYDALKRHQPKLVERLGGF